MKVILLKDVQHVGRKNEVKEVAEGYAINFLFPRGLAKVGTPKGIKDAEGQMAQIEADRKVKEELLAKNIEDLSKVTIEFKEKVNEKGHLFAGISKEMLAEKLKAQTRLNITPEFIQLEHPIKEMGEHVVEVKAHGKTGKFKLVVSPLE